MVLINKAFRTLLTTKTLTFNSFEVMFTMRQRKNTNWNMFYRKEYE